jgi:osmoprotectant transport system permease protein
MRSALWELALQHLALVAVSGLGSVLTGAALGAAVSLSRGRAFRDLLLNLSSFAETLPSAAVIALSLPLLGYGTAPTILALYLYGILPVLRNTITGLEEADPDASEAARGMGMGEIETLFRVRAVLALPVIIAGIRTAVIINISAATLGAAVGAGGFGVPIISGIRTFDPVMILRGAVPVTLLALFADSVLRLLAYRADAVCRGDAEGRAGRGRGSRKAVA